MCHSKVSDQTYTHSTSVKMTLYLKSEIQGFIISGSDGHVPLKMKEVVNDVNVYTASSEGCPACCTAAVCIIR